MSLLGPRAVTALLAASLAAGCATDYDLEQRRPDARYSSQKSVAVVRQCVINSLTAVGAPQITESNGSTRITVRTSGGYPATIVIVRPAATGTTVVVRQAISYSLGRAIEGCL